uniref:Septin-type G domain-containing protein n=1 Tax=Poecilia mexicana TaxID=48701 RepID=A0A3B3XG39_9TELE
LQREVISKSLLIQPGYPAIYQLKLKKEELGPLTKVTFGKKNISKMNKTILLVGETGAGKSTLINTMVNYAMGVKWEDKIWFQIVEEDGRSQSDSQTSDVIVYEIFGFEGKTMPFSLTIIDTPGFGDTRGIEKDAIVSHRLFDLFRLEDGVHEIHAVGLVMKATDNRLSDRLMYIFDSVMSLFGNDMEKNIVALITHSNGRTPKNPLQAIEAANLRCAKNENNQPVYFLFNNQQNEDRTDEAEYCKVADRISEKGMREFTAFVENSSPQKLKITTEVMNERIRLTACIQNLLERIRLTEQKQTEIKQIHEGLKMHEGEMKGKEADIVTIDETYKDKEPIKGGLKWLIFYQGAVTCPVCKENCHKDGCTKTWLPEFCEVMRGGRCTVCSKKCPASVHVKGKWIYVNKTRTVKKTIQQVKLGCENKTKFENQKHLLENNEKEMQQLLEEKFKLVDEAYQHVIRLEQIALKVDSVSINVHLDLLIEKTKEKGDTRKVQKLEEIKRKVDEGTKAALRYKNASQKLNKCTKYA